MRIFAIVLSRSNSEVSERIKRNYPDSYQISDTTFLVSKNTLAKTIAEAVGIKGGEPYRDF